jgi:hypothetical protein
MTDKKKAKQPGNGYRRCLDTIVSTVNECIQRNPNKNTNGLWVDLRVSDALTIIAELKEYSELFRLQKSRLDSAAKYWQVMTGQKDSFPDLGELLDFLMNRITLLETKLGDLLMQKLRSIDVGFNPQPGDKSAVGVEESVNLRQEIWNKINEFVRNNLGTLPNSLIISSDINVKLLKECELISRLEIINTGQYMGMEISVLADCKKEKIIKVAKLSI